MWRYIAVAAIIASGASSATPRDGSVGGCGRILAEAVSDWLPTKDGDSDGFLSRAEWKSGRRALQRVEGAPVSGSDLEKAFRSIDANGDHRLSRKELGALSDLAFCPLSIGGAASDSPKRRAKPVVMISPPGRALALSEIAQEIQSADRPWSVQKSGDTVRFEVRKGERRRTESERKRQIERAEISLREKFRFGRTYRIEYDMMVAAGPPNASEWVNIGQFHGTPDPQDADGLGPVVAMQLDGERMRVVARADPAAATKSRPADKWLFRDTADIQRDRWYHIRIDVRFDPQGQGVLNVWRDDVQLVGYAGPLGYNDTVGPYWKQGIYRRSTREPLSVSFRQLRISEPSAGTVARN